MTDVLAAASAGLAEGRAATGISAGLVVSALRRFADEGVVLEVCSTSTLFTGAIRTLVEHPARTSAAAGVSLVLGDDDPIQTGSPFLAERKVLRNMGIDLTVLDRTSLEAAFLSDAERAELTQQRRYPPP